jgi:hypothetical protein
MNQRHGTNQPTDSYATDELLLLQLELRPMCAKKFTQRILLKQLTFTREILSFSNR